MTRLPPQLWEEGIITCFVPGNFISVHTLNFCLHTCLPTMARLSQFQNSPSAYLPARSSVMHQRDLDSVCLRLHPSLLLTPTCLLCKPVLGQNPHHLRHLFPCLHIQSFPGTSDFPPNNVSSTFYFILKKIFFYWF